MKHTDSAFFPSADYKAALHNDPVITTERPRISHPLYSESLENAEEQERGAGVLNTSKSPHKLKPLGLLVVAYHLHGRLLEKYQGQGRKVNAKHNHSKPAKHIADLGIGGEWLLASSDDDAWNCCKGV